MEGWYRVCIYDSVMMNWLYYTSSEAQVIESKDDYIVRVNALGIPREDINVEVTGGVLSVEGKSDYVTVKEKFRLPSDVVAEGITAETKDGILTVRVPKGESAKGLKIEVK